ncbi:hypothetical protein AB0J57_15270 [Streptomyces sp. NPDC049837]|uniref:hypothetical protein n=1 Tax=Streptomyces sp. NPDC049837 TaxID=3155277 RepID=UPI00341E31C4
MPGIDECLREAMSLPGALGAALVDWTSGLALGTAGRSPVGDHETTAAETAELARAAAEYESFAPESESLAESLPASLPASLLAGGQAALPAGAVGALPAGADPGPARALPDPAGPSDGAGAAPAPALVPALVPARAGGVDPKAPPVEDVIVTTRTGYHVLRFVETTFDSSVFLHLWLDRSTGNLALARLRLRELAERLVLV